MSRTNAPSVYPRLCFPISLGRLRPSWGWHHCPIMCCSWYGKILKYLNSVGGVFVVSSLRPKYNFCHTCNFATHQTWADRLWERAHLRAAECCGTIDYSCCSSWALSILMWQMWPQTFNRCLAVNDTMNNLFVNIVYMDTVDVAFQK